MRCAPIVPPTPGRDARDALFSGTVHFAQITFHTSSGDKVIATADINQIVQYTQHAGRIDQRIRGPVQPKQRCFGITDAANQDSQRARQIIQRRSSRRLGSTISRPTTAWAATRHLRHRPEWDLGE